MPGISFEREARKSIRIPACTSGLRILSDRALPAARRLMNVRNGSTVRHRDCIGRR
jgi:hypothetical protein